MPGSNIEQRSPMVNYLQIGGNFLRYFACLLVASIITRSYEFVLGIWGYGSRSFDGDYLFYAFMNDLQLSSVAAIFMLSAMWILSRFVDTNTIRKTAAHLVAIFTAIQVLLISYFGATQMPLGAEFWGYSVSEMTSTVIAAEQLSLFGLALFVVMYAITYWIAIQIQSISLNIENKTQRPIALQATALLLVAGSFFFPTDENATTAQKDKQVNKLTYFMAESFSSFDWFKSSQLADDTDEYPLLHKANYSDDVLTPFFEDFEEPPNIVFLLVESLGGEFVGPSGQWTGFAPYLDSLSQQSLYWEHGLSQSGRTFGMMPSLLGSLPFGKNGFMDLGPDYPNHQSLISLLKDRGYYTAFFSGYDTSFDGLNFFLDHQGTDFILNKKKLQQQLPESQSQSNYWGVDDKTMLNFTAELLDTAQVHPRLEIYHTLQSHSPFTVPNAEKYQQEFNSHLESLGYSSSKEEAFRQHQEEFTTLLFADQAVKDFMEKYRQKEQYENTIFVITGDHWLIPVPQTTAISRYHVPIMIYSPRLKEPVHFKSVSTHAEITPSLVALLDQQTDLDMPEQVHWISGLMDTTREFQSKQSVPFMRNKNTISDYLDGDSYFFGDELYELSEGMELAKLDDSKEKERVSEKLNQFKSINDYVTENNKLYPGTSERQSQDHAFLSEYDTLYARLDSLDLTVDEQFSQARNRAHNNQYETARAIAKRILLRHSDYHDARILMGRTYAWEGNYEEAAGYFEEVIEADETYEDAYLAYTDNEYWEADYKKALEIINRALEHHPQNKAFLERKIKVLYELEEYQEATQTYENLEELDSEYDKLPELKKYIGE
ncbi:MAG: sulfatase-like hydrolase/transferase [Bacteroidota bacterium]